MGELSHEQKLRDRVQKLLALASSPNPHEAALAAGRAAALIAQYRLDHAELIDEKIEDAQIQIFRNEPLDASKRLRGWKIALASAVARILDCRIVVSGPQSGQRHGRKDNIRRIWIVGRPDDEQRLRWMYPSMVSLVQMVSRAKLQNASHRFREDFRRGLVASLHEQMQAQMQSQWQQGRDESTLRPAGPTAKAEPQGQGLAPREAQGSNCGDKKNSTPLGATPSSRAEEFALVPSHARPEHRGMRVERWMEERLGLHFAGGKGVSVILAAYRAGQEAGAELSQQLVDMMAKP